MLGFLTGRRTGKVYRLLGIMMAANPGVRAFVRIPRRPDGHLDRDRLEAAIQHGFRIVRWHLDDPSQ